MRALLQSHEVAFVLVSGTRATQQAAMRHFHETLGRANLSASAIVLNRLRPFPFDPAASEVVHQQMSQLLGSGEPYDSAARALDQEMELARQDHAARKALEAEMGNTSVIAVPELPLDVHDLEGLSRIHRHFLPIPVPAAGLT